MELKAKIDNGIIKFYNRQHSEAVMKKYEGKETLITIDKWINKKSVQQCRYLHKIIAIVAEELGYTPEGFKTAVKKELGLVRYESDLKNDMLVAVYDSVANMNKEQISEMIEFILQYASENGIKLLTPQEYFEN